MKRNDKEITTINEKIDIINKCKVCRIGLSENNKPYIVTLNYGYDFNNNSLTLFFHSAKEGRKMDIIKTNNNSCFEINCDTQLIEGEKACKYSYSFKSIIGFGKIIFMEDSKDKIFGLNKIMKHQTGKNDIFIFSQEELNKVAVYKMVVDEFTGKQKIF
jgi:nitroimidazol reductase NimA-like FMN-containing flavoprotein (pyridoxamine 5'-phosphate oxidase superfamily)